MVKNMLIKNIENFPIVDLSYRTEDQVGVDETIAMYEVLLDKQQPFVFLSEGKMDQENNDHEARKKVAIWVKQNRERLTHYVKALVHIEPEESLRLEAQKFANNFIKFSGYPMFIVESQAKADLLIDSVLKQKR